MKTSRAQGNCLGYPEICEQWRDGHPETGMKGEVHEMRWQYRTVIFEFHKDGLLGDRFIDDEEMEKTLNEQGRAGWELISATMVQDGLLTLFKRPDRYSPLDSEVEEASSTEDPLPEVREDEQETFSAEDIRQQEREHIRTLEQQRRQAMEEQEKFMVGDIKIS